MTKLEEFIKSKTGEFNSFDQSEAEFWLRSFVKLVRERGQANDRGLTYAIGLAFNEIVKEFGLENK